MWRGALPIQGAGVRRGDSHQCHLPGTGATFQASVPKAQVWGDLLGGSSLRGAGEGADRWGFAEAGPGEWG